MFFKELYGKWTWVAAGPDLEQPGRHLQNCGPGRK